LLAQKYKEHTYNQTIEGLYQEYFHVVVPPDMKRFRSEFFQKLGEYELKQEFGYNWIKLDNKWNLANIEFGVDLAGMGLDDTVITVVAMLSDSRILVLHQAIGKWTLRDVVYQDTSKDLRLNRVITDRSNISKIGVIDEMFRLWMRYKPSKIKIGIAGEEEQVLFLTQQVFRENKVYDIYIQGRPQTVREGKKVERIMSTLLPYYETRMVYHSPNLSKLEHQLEYLGKSKNDDCADSLEVAMWTIQPPYSTAKYEDMQEMNQKKKDTYLDPAKRYLPEFNIHNNFRDYF
jgi:hypothetical protein